MNETSIYHQKRFGKSLTIRFNLAAVRRLLPEYTIKDFNLTERQKAKMQRRVNLYVKLGGNCDLGTGMEAKPEQFIPSRVIKERPERVIRGKVVKATKREIIPARIEPSTPEIPPSLDHLPNHEILERALRMDLSAYAKGVA